MTRAAQKAEYIWYDGFEGVEEKVCCAYHERTALMLCQHGHRPWACGASLCAEAATARRMIDVMKDQQYSSFARSLADIPLCVLV